MMVQARPSFLQHLWCTTHSTAPDAAFAGAGACLVLGLLWLGDLNTDKTLYITHKIGIKTFIIQGFE